VTWLRYWRGRWRLRFGFCPLCYSSPPNKTCPICAGWYEYGGNLSDAKRDIWRARWDSRAWAT